jgi:hypothetical protein
MHGTPHDWSLCRTAQSGRSWPLPAATAVPSCAIARSRCKDVGHVRAPGRRLHGDWRAARLLVAPIVVDFGRVTSSPGLAWRALGSLARMFPPHPRSCALAPMPAARQAHWPSTLILQLGMAAPPT